MMMYANFLARLETSISHTIIGEEAIKQLEKLLAYENANQGRQRAIAPIRGTGTIFDYLKPCRNLESETQKICKCYLRQWLLVLIREMKNALHVEIRAILKGTALSKLIKKPP